MAEDLKKPAEDGQKLARSALGRFIPGHKGVGGRKKGALNKTKRTIKEALNQAAAEIGYDGKGEGGVEGFLERVGRDDPVWLATAVVRSNVPPAGQADAETGTGGGGGSVTINIHPVVEGNQFAPGGSVLLPCEEASRAWTAYRDGAEAWQKYLAEIKSQLTLEAFENLSSVVPPEPGTADNVVNLRAHKSDNDATQSQA